MLYAKNNIIENFIKAPLFECVMNNLKGVKRIDIGCGMPNQKFKDCFGIDINLEYKPDLLHNCEEGLPFADKSLEFINSDNSLEHFKNPYFVLEECYRSLKKWGKMRLVVPNCQYFPLVFINLFYDIDKFWHWYMNLKFKKERTVHYVLFTKFLISKLAKEAGFKVKSVKGGLYSKEIKLMLQK